MKLIVIIDSIASEYIEDEWYYYPRTYAYGFETENGIYVRWLSNNDFIEVCRKCGSEFHWHTECRRKKNIVVNGYEFYKLNKYDMKWIKKFSDNVYITENTLVDNEILQEVSKELLEEVSWKEPIVRGGF